MNSINTYLCVVFEQFKIFLSGTEKLCENKKLNYDNKDFPNYALKQIQEHYILRYTFSYAYEYKQMFLKCIPDHGQFLIDPNLRILSLGCGNAIDYWSLAQAVHVKKLTSRIFYDGVDKIKWNYTPDKRIFDSLNIEIDDIIDYLAKNQKISANYIVFPKSISEFNDQQFSQLTEVFRNIHFENKRICILATFRSSEQNLKTDTDRFHSIIVNIRKNKNNEFVSVGKPYKLHIGEDRKIEDIDLDFEYPKGAKKIVSELHTHCITFKETSSNCQNCEKRLDRKPVQCSKDNRYGIAILEKKVIG